MFTPIKILHRLPFLRLILFLVLGILLASFYKDVNLGFLFLILTLILALIGTFLSPHLSYLKGIVIFFACFTLGYFSVIVPKPFFEQESTLAQKATTFKEYTTQLLDNKLDNKSSALCKALCLADKSSLNSKVKKEFSRAGASHILAVSGMHVGIIFTAISTLLSLVSKERRFQLFGGILSICFLWFYAYICGLQPSIIRACTMFSVPIIGKLLKRDASSFNSLLFTAFCMLIYDYTYLNNIGFQLSFLAVAGILLFQEKIFNIFPLQNKILIWIWSLTSVSIAAQITTLPLTIYYFRNLPIFSLITNLFVVPLATLLIYFTGSLLIFQLTSLSSIISLFLNKLSNISISLIEEISNLPYSVIEDINISALQVAILYAIILLFYHFIWSKKPATLMWILSCFILFIVYDIINLLFL